MSDDIVTRLRAVLHNDRSVELMNREAADEIERLRVELDGSRAAFEVMRAERDEARREVCQLMRSDDYNEPFDGTVFEYAVHRGWDCFKEATDER